MFKKIAILVIVAFTGITVVQASFEVNTLGANKSISNSFVKKQVDADTARVLLETPYKGFYQISSKVVNKTITFPKVRATRSFPDERWEVAAKAIASLAETRIASTGSRIETGATAYVAFYDPDMIGVDRSKVRRLSSSVEEEPNTLAVLVIKYKSHTNARNAQRGKKAQSGSNIYLFELAI